MTTEDGDIEGGEDKAEPQGDGLWEDVRFWFAAIVSVYGDLKELMQVGLTRSLGVKLCNWLWGV